MPTVKIGTQPPISPFFAGTAADGDVGAPENTARRFLARRQAPRRHDARPVVARRDAS